MSSKLRLAPKRLQRHTSETHFEAVGWGYDLIHCSELMIRVARTQKTSGTESLEVDNDKRQILAKIYLQEC